MSDWLFCHQQPSPTGHFYAWHSYLSGWYSYACRRSNNVQKETNSIKKAQQRLGIFGGAGGFCPRVHTV